MWCVCMRMCVFVVCTRIYQKTMLSPLLLSFQNTTHLLLNFFDCFLLQQLYWGIINVQKLHTFNVCNLIRLDICIYLLKHHHNQGNIHHLPNFLVPLSFPFIIGYWCYLRVGRNKYLLRSHLQKSSKDAFTLS